MMCKLTLATGPDIGEGPQSVAVAIICPKHASTLSNHGLLTRLALASALPGAAPSPPYPHHLGCTPPTPFPHPLVRGSCAAAAPFIDGAADQRYKNEKPTLDSEKWNPLTPCTKQPFILEKYIKIKAQWILLKVIQTHGNHLYI